MLGTVIDPVQSLADARTELSAAFASCRRSARPHSGLGTTATSDCWLRRGVTGSRSMGRHRRRGAGPPSTIGDGEPGPPGLLTDRTITRIRARHGTAPLPRARPTTPAVATARRRPSGQPPPPDSEVSARGRSPGQHQGHPRALGRRRAPASRQQRRVIHQDPATRRVPPVVEPDQLRHDLRAIPRAVAQCGVDPKPVPRRAHRHPRRRRGGGGSVGAAARRRMRCPASDARRRSKHLERAPNVANRPVGVVTRAPPIDLLATSARSGAVAAGRHLRCRAATWPRR